MTEVEASEWEAIDKVVNGKKKETGQEWAEVCFVPNATGHSKKGPEYRYVAKREALAEQQILPGMDDQLELPSPTMNAMMKKMALGESWEPKRMKAFRFSLINLPERVVKRSRSLVIWLTKNYPSFELLIEVRKEIAKLKPLPCG